MEWRGMDIEILKELVCYDQLTGEFTWNTARRGCKSGKLAGSVSKNGYIVICLQNKDYYAHRLAWFYVTGEWPPYQIDHIDGTRSNNKWDNLRLATNKQNSWNKKNVAGVYEYVRKGRPGLWYEAKIEKDGKRYSTCKRNFQDALNWRKDKEKELFGEFAR